MNNYPAGESKDASAAQPERKSPLTLIPQRFFEAEQKLKPGLLFWAALVGILTGGVGTFFRIAVDQIIQGREHLIQLVKDYPVLNWLVPTVLSAVMVYLAFLEDIGVGDRKV